MGKTTAFAAEMEDVEDNFQCGRVVVEEIHIMILYLGRLGGKTFAFLKMRAEHGIENRGCGAKSASLKVKSLHAFFAIEDKGHVSVGGNV